MIVAASAAVGGGGIAGVGASLGVAVARNYIGWAPNYEYEADCATGDTDVPSIDPGDTVKIAGGPNAGNVYEYIGTETLSRPTISRDDYDDGDEGDAAYQTALIEAANWLTRLDYSDQSQWRLANFEKNAAQVQAYILNSTVDASGALTLDAISSQAIHATVFAGSVALTGGLVGVSVSGAGASSENRIATFVQAYIQDDEDKTSVAGASIGLNASDSSKINSFTGAVSVAASGGLVGVSLSIGVGVASNQIDSHVASFIKDIDAGNGVTTDTGDISIKASETATIHATAVAASAAVALGGVGASLSGAGAVASNVILGCANAYIENSILASAARCDPRCGEQLHDRGGSTGTIGCGRRRRVRRLGSFHRRGDRPELHRLFPGRRLVAHRGPGLHHHFERPRRP